MNFSQAIQSGFSNYTKFTGRAGVMEFWYWVLFTVLGTIASGILDAVLFPPMSYWSPLSDIFTLVTFLPGIAVSIRRLHDTDRTGWWFLLVFIPLLGTLLLIVWWIQQGSAGDNQYGANPLPVGRLGARTGA